MEKLLLVNPEKCTACRRCELVCSARHTGEFNPSRSRVSAAIFLEDNFYMPLVCQHCDEPVCMEICPAGAITKNPDTGAVVIEEAKCVGCRMCMMACPFGAISYSPEERKMVKCDLCGGEPECALFCPWGAIEYIEADRAAIAKKREIAAKLKNSLKEVHL